MSARISRAGFALRAGALALLAAASVVSLERGGAVRAAWRAYPPPLARPMPKGLDWFSLVAALGDAPREASDIGYIACLQYMGGSNADDGFFGKTLELYSRVQWLDPGFQHAVLEGVSALGWLYARPAQAETLARAAMAADPRDARYAVYLAALAYQRRLDSAGVLRALAPEVRRPDASDMLLRVVGNLLLRQRRWRRAWVYWMWLLGRAREEETRVMARRTLKALRPRLRGPLPPPPPPLSGPPL